LIFSKDYSIILSNFFALDFVVELKDLNGNKSDEFLDIGEIDNE